MKTTKTPQTYQPGDELVFPALPGLSDLLHRRWPGTRTALRPNDLRGELTLARAQVKTALGQLLDLERQLVRDLCTAGVDDQRAQALVDDLDLVRDQVTILWRLTRANGGVA